MTLKKANKIAGKYKEALMKMEDFLSWEKNHYVTTTEHLRSHTDPEAEDKTEVADPEKERGYSTLDVIKACGILLEEEEALERAVAYAKLQAPIDIDSAEEVQNLRKRYCNSLQVLLKKELPV